KLPKPKLGYNFEILSELRSLSWFKKAGGRRQEAEGIKGRKLSHPFFLAGYFLCAVLELLPTT
ncbi:MAG: hypothetical protein F6K41_43235, partial [Symploca sp. SIO3E6]|nr:hypothetical protein [Caldora sp. SIO3E6]